MVLCKKYFPPKNLYGNIFLANIVCKKWFFIQVEIKKKYYWNCCLCPSNGHRRQFHVDPNQCHYPIMTYHLEKLCTAAFSFKDYVKYRTLAIISHSWLQAALEYKPYIRTEFSEKTSLKQRNGIWKWSKKYTSCGL